MKKYSMSFTTATLLYHESVKLAALYPPIRQWDKVRNAVVADNIIQARTTNTLKRVTNEITSRLKTLSEQEIRFFNEAGYADQKYILWLSICRRYAFIADFAVDVVYDNFVTLKNSVSHDDYNMYFNKKAEWHGELDRIAASTKRKLRQTLFKIMQEANLLDTNNMIIPVIPSTGFLAVLAAATPREGMFFPVSERIRRAG